MLEQWIVADVVGVVCVVLFCRTLRGVTRFKENKKSLTTEQSEKRLLKNT